MQLIETYTDLPVESRTAYRIIAENKLLQVEQYDSSLTLTSTSTYSYDGLGRRVKKDVNGTVTFYIYDDEDIRFETDELGTITAEYTHGPGIDAPLAMRRGGQNYYYHVNGLGSITALTDSSTDSPKTVVQSYVYDSFGQTISQSGSIQNPYTYTGREYDSETGMYYYRARYYDAKMGRFISEDPIGIVGGINLYVYTGNNPVNWVDPYGLRMRCRCQGSLGSSECRRTRRCWWEDDPPTPEWVDNALCFTYSYFVCPILGLETGGVVGAVCGWITTLSCPDEPDPDPEPPYPPPPIPDDLDCN